MSLALGDAEATALVRLSVVRTLPPELRAALGRLLHLRLIEETAEGYRLTPRGAARAKQEAAHRGRTAPRPVGRRRTATPFNRG